MANFSLARQDLQRLLYLTGMAILLVARPGLALADGGGFPAPTPTITLTPTPAPTNTPEPTSAPTNTPTVTSFPLSVDLQGEQSLQITTAAPTAQVRAGIVCWPFAVILLLIVIVGSTWLHGRRRSGPY